MANRPLSLLGIALQRARTGACLTLFATLAVMTMVGCGTGGGALSSVASCTAERSELGPFSPDTALGSSMTEEAARAQMAQDGIIAWLALSAVGPWDEAWDSATSELGGAIHDDLSWLDVDGELRGLYEAGDAYGFDDLRVSRSFQGKIEHNADPIYLPLQDSGREINFDAGCVISSITVGDQDADELLDVTAAISIAP